jgi:hypothetical protein
MIRGFAARGEKPMSILNRRNALLAGIGALSCGLSKRALAQDVPRETSAEIQQPVLPVTEQLMYSTVRLVHQDGNSLHWGTGFMFTLFKTGNSGAQVIITNKHVVDGWNSCTFSWASAGANGPNLNSHIPVEIADLPNKMVVHPSVDLVAIAAGYLLDDVRSKGQQPFAVALDESLIPTDDELKQLFPVEQVLTVGYPGMLWDDVHNLPVFHRGYTATPPNVEFKGKREFLIDIATWPGASGSPVLLYNEGSWLVRNSGTVMGGLRAKLLGIVYGVGAQDVSGDLVIQNAPTQIKAQLAVPTNLGACISASRILEFEPLLLKQGYNPPSGYVMRAPH